MIDGACSYVNQLKKIVSNVFVNYTLHRHFPEIDQAQLLTGKNETTVSGVDEIHDIDDETRTIDDELRKMLADIFTDNARLRKQVISITRHALKLEIMSKKEDEAPSGKNVVNTPLER
jgi:hypothetical protein